MNSNDAVKRVIRELQASGIPYMVVGSYSSNAYGIVRSTQDVDFVIEAGNHDLGRVFESLKPDIIFDPQMRLESVTFTLRYVGQVVTSSFKIELFLTNDRDEHDVMRFSRRRLEPFLDVEAMLPSPEDVVIQKLRWYGRAKRNKDHDDAKSILSVRKGNLDLSYIRSWADKHGTREIFETIQVAVEKL